MKLQLLLPALAMSFLSLQTNAQDFMLQGWYWDYPKTCDGANWAQTLDAQAADLGNAGFTYAWLPPLSRASFGSCSNGYDPKDLYDLGEYGLGPTGFGSRADLNGLISALNSNGVASVADVVYNHRDGGAPEDNPWVKDYITIHFNNTKNPFPSDRFRCVLPLGGSSGNGAGDYYFKISSKTQDNRFTNKPYSIRMETSVVGMQGLPDQNEAEPNGGGDCGEAFNDIQLGVQMLASVDGAGCRTDEFKLTLTAADFNAAGDELVIRLNNFNGDYTDHRIYGIWNTSASRDVANQLKYQTFTNFNGLPSGQGGMNFENFRPNSTNATTNTLGGDWDAMLFFYDYDQYRTDTQNKLYDWTTWLWNNVGIRGFRMDAVKHFDPAFVGGLMNHLDGQGINPGMVVGEFFDGNPNSLNGWVNDVQANMNASALQNIDVRIFDFAMREALKNACDQFGYDVRSLFNSGLVDGLGTSAFNVVTFANNHDFRGPGEPIQNDPMLAYAYLLTNNRIGLPTVFYPDYYGTTIPNAPTNTLKPAIDDLMRIHQQFIFQANSIDYLTRFGTPYTTIFTDGFPSTTLVYQISGGIGGAEVVVAINFAGTSMRIDQELNGTNISVGELFLEQTGNGLNSMSTVDGSNRIRMELPARSYGVWIQNPAILPLELLSFDAQQLGSHTLLDWQTRSEQDVKGFEIQRSVDGKYFEPFGWKDARNQNGLVGNYQFQDHSLPMGGTVYYRLKMIDLDGQHQYSTVKAVQQAATTAEFQVAPNPANQAFSIRIPESAWGKDLQVQLFHGSGQLLRSWQAQQIQADWQQFDISDLPSGTYWLRLESGQSTYSTKLLKM
ncbi:MAG: alpha-amylase family glycosyl hydrolase [Bacteroidota bacterium]